MSRSLGRWSRVAIGVVLVACAEPVSAPGRGAPPDLQGRVLAGASDFTRLVAGFVHTCALSADGSAFCWGSNDYAQLGARTTATCSGRACSIDPLPVRGDHRFATIAAGWVTSCGVTPDGEGWCWGGGPFDGRGYLGDGNLARTVDPVRVATDSPLVAITLGDGHGCALTASGAALCWGQNNLGQLGDGTRADREVPVFVSTTKRFATLSAGASHTCGVTTENETLCWGDNRWGQLGIGDVEFGAGAAVELPTAVADQGHVRFASVASGWQHTCGLDVDGFAYCWGRNDLASQLGDDSEVTHRGVPGRVAGSVRFAVISAGALTTCARTEDAEGYCWGGNYHGVLATGGTDARGIGHPVQIGGGPFTRLRVGQSHACAVGTDRRLWCWGDRSAGQY